MRDFLKKLGLTIAIMAFGSVMWSQSQTTLGELKHLSRIWDGTDVALVDGSGNLMVGDGSGPLTVDGTVTANAGTNLNTSALLTTSAHDAAFGTAGTADAQVRTIQGIASMTPVVVSATDLDVQSGGADLATAAGQTTIIGHVDGLEGFVDGVEALLTTLTGWDESARAKVNPIVGSAGVAGNTGTVGATTQRVTLATDVALPAGTNAIGKLAANSGVDIGDVDVTSLPANASVNVAQLAGNTASSGNGASGTGTFRVTVANDSTGIIQNVPGTAGGTLISRTVAGASTNATNVKASAGQVYQIVASNVNAAARFVHLYNNSGSPTCNASIVATFIIPGNSTGAGTNINLNPGLAFGTGIAFCITTANDGTGSVSASDVVLNVIYK